MQNWQDTLAFVAAWGCTGAFIDFVIGKTGQKRVKDRLETFWIRIADLPVRSFSRVEAETAYSVLHRLFGSAFSLHRLRGLALLITVNALIALTITSLRGGKFMFGGIGVFAGFLFGFGLAIAIWISVSLTLALCKLGSRLIPESTLSGILVFSSLIALQIFFDRYVSERVSMISTEMLLLVASLFSDVPGAATSQWHSLLLILTSTYPGTFFTSAAYDFGASYIELFMSLAPHLIGWLRLYIAVMFLLSFLKVPLVRMLMLLIYRVIETEKPIFTLTFGGIAGLAKAIEQLVQKL